MNALLNSLTEAELQIVRETERDRLAELDEDALVDVHTRVRRTRNKYVKLYRREASTRVKEHGGRGKARPKNRRNAQKAEVFEEALARVSRFLAVAARRSAAALKAERLDAARRDRKTKPPKAKVKHGGKAKKEQRARTFSKPPAMLKEHAASRAKGARRQAKRDAG